MRWEAVSWDNPRAPLIFFPFLWLLLYTVNTFYLLGGVNLDIYIFRLIQDLGSTKINHGSRHIVDIKYLKNWEDLVRRFIIKSIGIVQVLLFLIEGIGISCKWLVFCCIWVLSVKIYQGTINFLIHEQINNCFTIS